MASLGVMKEINSVHSPAAALLSSRDILMAFGTGAFGTHATIPHDSVLTCTFTGDELERTMYLILGSLNSHILIGRAIFQRFPLSEPADL